MAMALSGTARLFRLLGVAVISLSMLFVLASCSVTNPVGPNHSRGWADCLESLGAAPSAVTGVFVEPDDGYPPVIDELNGARCRIDLSVYMLTDDTIFQALIDAASRDVEVRVILDEHPFGMFGNQQEAMDRLLAGGVHVQWGAPEHQFTHAKYAVIDERVALVMNQNFTRSAFDGNREFGLVTTDPAVVHQASDIFAADWNETSSESVEGPLVVSPENSRARIIALINDAETSIDFYAEVFRDSGILDALRDATQRGVTVRLIVNASLDPDDMEMLIALSESGVQVRLMEQFYIHAKTMIVDGDAALIGSQNYTMTSLDRNREVGMVITDPALVDRVVSIYERDWVRAVPAATVPVIRDSVDQVVVRNEGDHRPQLRGPSVRAVLVPCGPTNET